MAITVDSVHRQGQEPRPELLLAVPPPCYSDSADILSEPRRRSKLKQNGEAAQRKNGELQELKYWGSDQQKCGKSTYQFCHILWLFNIAMV